MLSQTESYYTAYAKAFIARSEAFDLTSAHTRFLKHLPQGAYLLDAGCGSGRDSKVFNEKGYRVLAIDSCPEFVAYTQEHAKVEARCMDFRDLAFENTFDGIWACASLLHIQPEILPTVFESLYRALKPKGVFYASFKKGDFVGVRDQRWFTDLERDTLQLLLPEGLRILEYWQSDSVKPNNEQEKWLNVILCA